MDDLKKLLENAGLSKEVISEDEYGRDQGALNEPDGEYDATDDYFYHVEAAIDDLITKLDAEVEEIVDANNMHEAFRKSLKVQAKKLMIEKLSSWPKQEIEYLQRLPKSQGGDVDDADYPMADPTGTLKRDIDGNIGPTK